MSLRAPFPYFGGKSKIAAEVWARLGNPPNYVEPFFGSGAVLLGRPDQPHTETVNDLNCYLTNFWRAIQADPLEVARWADWPVSELDKNARHYWLVNQTELRERMSTDTDYYDAKAAGWWVWGLNIWIGAGWCAEPKTRKLPHLGDAGRGINRQLPHLGNAGMGIAAWFMELQQRLRRVRIACGDWQRVLTPAVTIRHGITAVFLDPPYECTDNEYTVNVEAGLSAAVRQWALENGENPEFRIALCGYDGEHEMPGSWECLRWKARKGYQKVQDDGSHTGHQETIWFSPHCLRPQERLFTPAAMLEEATA